MAHDALTPVFVGLRTGLHLLFIALIALVVGRAVLAPTDSRAAVLVLAMVLVATYAAGGLLARGARAGSQLTGLVWLGLVSLEWFALLWLTPEAAYLVFPLFFLYLLTCTCSALAMAPSPSSWPSRSQSWRSGSTPGGASVE